MDQKSIFLRHGLPFIVLTVGGWIMLSQFVKGRLDVEDAKRKELDLRAPVEKQQAKKFNAEEELERLQAHRSRNYENKPVPRPKDWDGSHS